MPVYLYEHIAPPSTCPVRFERIERMSDEPLTHCPDCGAAIHRVPARFATGRNVLSTGNLKEHGFTRLRRRDKGVYEPD